MAGRLSMTSQPGHKQHLKQRQGARARAARPWRWERVALVKDPRHRHLGRHHRHRAPLSRWARVCEPALLPLPPCDPPRASQVAVRSYLGNQPRLLTYVSSEDYEALSSWAKGCVRRRVEAACADGGLPLREGADGYERVVKRAFVESLPELKARVESMQGPIKRRPKPALPTTQNLTAIEEARIANIARNAGVLRSLGL